MIQVGVSDLQWINGAEDDPADQCAHGCVLLSIDRTRMVEPSDGLWTVSASGLYLLRTLEFDHTESKRAAQGSQLFPCCGFNVWPQKGRFPVILVGCRNGIDVWIVHEKEHVVLTRGEPSGRTSSHGWKSSVLAFVDQIEGFYDRCSPKETPGDDEDRAGWQAFWQEWRERKEAAERSL